MDKREQLRRDFRQKRPFFVAGSCLRPTSFPLTVSSFFWLAHVYEAPGGIGLGGLVQGALRPGRTDCNKPTRITSDELMGGPQARRVKRC